MKTERDAFLLTILWQFRMAKFKVETELLFTLVLLLLGEVGAGILMEFDFEFRISKITLRKYSDVRRGSIPSSAQFDRFLSCIGFLTGYVGLTQNVELYLLPVL